MIPKLLLTASLLLVAALGCDCKQPQCDGPTCDPFALGQTFYSSPHNDNTTQAKDTSVNLVALHETKNGGCPTCPQARPTPSYASTQYSGGFNLNPGESLLWVQPLSECRPTPQATMPRPTASTPPCPTGNCPQRPIQKPFEPDDVKEGIFRCSMCGRATVGREWHELWTDDRISLTCMCEQCWRNASPKQIESTIRNYASKAGINVRSATVQAVIREASAQ